MENTFGWFLQAHGEQHSDSNPKPGRFHNATVHAGEEGYVGAVCVFSYVLMCVVGRNNTKFERVRQFS